MDQALDRAQCPIVDIDLLGQVVLTGRDNPGPGAPGQSPLTGHVGGELSQVGSQRLDACARIGPGNVRDAHGIPRREPGSDDLATDQTTSPNHTEVRCGHRRSRPNGPSCGSRTGR